MLPSLLYYRFTKASLGLFSGVAIFKGTLSELCFLLGKHGLVSNPRIQRPTSLGYRNLAREQAGSWMASLVRCNEERVLVGRDQAGSL